MAPDQHQQLEELVRLVAGGRVLVLSGAGLSTESGIPDYRGPSGLLRRSLPMTYQSFVGDPAARRRYWARSHLGWRHITHAVPNAGHLAVTELERRGLLAGTITQNVDGLHQAAGARDVVDLHGRLDGVVCLDCGAISSREVLDDRLRAVNADWQAQVTAINPDGDVDLVEGALDGFTPVDCEICGGMLKPDVVFFGETVPRERVQGCFARVEAAGALLVLGSSLTVMSGFRFVLRAAKVGVPVAIVNQGPTRGDERAVATVDAPLGRVLPAVVEALDARVRRTG